MPLVELCLDVAPRVFISGPLANPLYAALFTHKDSGEADGGLFVRTGMLEKLAGATAEFATVPQLMDVTEIDDEEGLLTSLHFDGDMAEDHTRAFVATLIEKWRAITPHPEDGRKYLDVQWSAMAMVTRGVDEAAAAATTAQ